MSGGGVVEKKINQQKKKALSHETCSALDSKMRKESPTTII